ncbi:nucleotidyltransferase family protein [Ruminococcus bromii]|uniref:tRNA(Met) cytidine acetate ligase n=1 Tax=Ruminococcus bromii TaxID=40518 RepID=UPI0039F5BC9E
MSFGGEIMATAVICEFNPFHNGHKYLLESAKKVLKEPIIAIMSGSFTQRGEVAVCDKFVRTKSALENGADLVLELPVVFSLSGAEGFARAGVAIASAFDCTNHLAFGSESGDCELLKRSANAVCDERVQALVRDGMKNGGYYPRELESAVKAVFGDGVSSVLCKPNNILAVEYIKALSGTSVEPFSVARTGVAHDSRIAGEGFASASHIREMLRNGENAKKYAPYVPDEITFSENLDRPLLYRLRTMTREEISKLPDVGEGLENRIADAAMQCSTSAEIADFVKTKRYTHARIRRILSCALLGIEKAHTQIPIEYVRVLGFTKDGAELLKDCRLNVVTSAIAGLKIGGSTKALLEKDISAYNISALAYRVPKKGGLDFTTQIVKI